MQTTVCESDSGWGSHVDGAAALLKLRGKDNLRNPFQRSISLYVLRNTVSDHHLLITDTDWERQILSHMQKSYPMDPTLAEIMSEGSYESIEDKLLSKTIYIPKLQHIAGQILSSGPGDNDGGVIYLLHQARKLETELSQWAADVAAIWQFKTFHLMPQAHVSDSSKSTFVASYIHQYHDIYVARVWNIYRVSRLIVQSILLRALGWLSHNPHVKQPAVGISEVEATIKSLISDICASVPYLLGFDVSNLKSRAGNPGSDIDMWPQDSMELDSSSSQKGRLSLLWPLYTARSSPLTTASQRVWITSQLRWLGEAGGVPQ